LDLPITVELEAQSPEDFDKEQQMLLNLNLMDLGF
jgi:hypothetical protein